MEAQHEAHGTGELGEEDEGLEGLAVHHGPRQDLPSALGAAGFFLNIWSIRSVTT